VPGTPTTRIIETIVAVEKMQARMDELAAAVEKLARRLDAMEQAAARTRP
jgi:predicted ATP-grasp superfamily ATP-dependent carboligase